MTIKSEVIALLQDNEHLRDDVGGTALLYADVFFDGDYKLFIASNIQSTIRREWQDIQKKMPELRGKNWKSRQVRGHAVRMGKKHRNLGQYEDCSNIFKPIKKKESIFQYISHKFF